MNKNKKDKTEVLSGAPVISWDWNLLQRPERGKCIIMSGHTGIQGEDGLKRPHCHPPWESPSALVLQWPLHTIILSAFSHFSPFFPFLLIFLFPKSMQPPSLTLKLPVGPFPWNLRCLELSLSFGKWVQIFILEIALLQNITVHLSCWVHNPPPQNTFLHTLL